MEHAESTSMWGSDGIIIVVEITALSTTVTSVSYKPRGVDATLFDVQYVMGKMLIHEMHFHFVYLCDIFLLHVVIVSSIMVKGCCGKEFNEHLTLKVLFQINVS